MNCPNCNGNEFINGRCQYCGAQFWMDFGNRDATVIPIYISGEKIDEVVTCEVVTRLYADNGKVFTYRRRI